MPSPRLMSEDTQEEIKQMRWERQISSAGSLLPAQEGQMDTGPPAAPQCDFVGWETGRKANKLANT